MAITDGHEDLAYFLRWAHSYHINFENFTGPFESGDLGGEVDLARLQKGRVGGAFFSTFADCPKEGFSSEYFQKGTIPNDE